MAETIAGGGFPMSVFLQEAGDFRPNMAELSRSSGGRVEFDKWVRMTRIFGMKVSVQEAKANFSKLLATVEAGEEVIVSRHRKPVARLVPVAKVGVDRIGGLAGRPFRMGRSFDHAQASDAFADDFGIARK